MPQTIIFEPASWRRQPHLSALVILVGMIGGFALSIGVLTGVRAVRAMQAMRWRSVPGVIVSSEVRDDTLTVNPHRDGTVGFTTVRRFYVTYAYSIAGVRYSGSRFDALTPRGAELPSRNELRYPTGAAVAIHVDPRNPANAFLEVPIPILALLTTVIALAIGVCILRWVWGEVRWFRRAALSNVH